MATTTWNKTITWNQRWARFLSSDYYQNNTRAVQDDLELYYSSSADWFSLIHQNSKTLGLFNTDKWPQSIDQHCSRTQHAITGATLAEALEHLTHCWKYGESEWLQAHIYRWQAETGQITQGELTMSLLKL